MALCMPWGLTRANGRQVFLMRANDWASKAWQQHVSKPMKHMRNMKGLEYWHRFATCSSELGPERGLRDERAGNGRSS